MNAETLGTNKERAVTVFNGWIALPIAILPVVGGLTMFIYSIVAGVNELKHPIWVLFAVGLIGVFVGELYAATAGIGFMVTVAGATFQTDKVFVGILIFIIVGLVGTNALDRVERRFDKWRPKVGADQ